MGSVCKSFSINTSGTNMYNLDNVVHVYVYHSLLMTAMVCPRITKSINYKLLLLNILSNKYCLKRRSILPKILVSVCACLKRKRKLCTLNQVKLCRRHWQCSTVYTYIHLLVHQQFTKQHPARSQSVPCICKNTYVNHYFSVMKHLHHAD